MNETKGEGQLIFEGPNFNEHLRVQWKLVSGDALMEGNSWRASITFFSHPVPEKVIKLIFNALSVPSTKMKLQTDDGIEVACHICNVLDLPDSGNIEIASPDMPKARMM